MGCGRVGSRLASMLDQEGHIVTVVDVDSKSFRRLAPSFAGVALVGDGTDEETLTSAGAGDAHVFIAVTQGDNRNIMACQIAKEIFHVAKVIARIYDPMRQDTFRELGLVTYCPTTVVTNMIHETIEQ